MILLIVGPILFIVSFYLVDRSLENLPVRYSPYWDFGKYFPDAGKWSVILFISLLLAIVTVFAIFAGVNLTNYRT